MDNHENQRLLSWPEIFATTQPVLDTLVQRLRQDAEAYYVVGDKKEGSLPLLSRQELLQATSHLLQLLDRYQALLIQEH